MAKQFGKEKVQFDKLVKRSDKVLIIASQPLDPDCIGSGLILKKYIESINNKVTLVFPRKYKPGEAENYSYLPFFDEIEATDSRNYLSKQFDTLILIDGANWTQFYDYKNTILPPPDFTKIKHIVHIDHHLNPGVTAEIAIQNSQSSSTVELILTTIVPESFITEQIATLAYAALVADTGNFMWNFTATTLQLAALLISKGAKNKEVNEIMFFSNSQVYFDMLAFTITNTTYDASLHTQFLLLPNNKIIKDGLSEAKLDMIGNAFTQFIARKVAGFPRGIIMTEEKDNQIYIGGRGSNLNNTIDLPELFKHLGGNGGGHFNSAGVTCTGDFEEIKEKLKSTLKKMLQEG